MDGFMSDVDLSIAMMFFMAEKDSQGVVLQCPRASDVPYIRHDLIRLFGEPDRILSDKVFYDRRPMRIVPLASNHAEELSGNRGRAFYIGFADGRDNLVLNKYGIEVDDRPWRSIQLWKSSKVGLSGMLKMLGDMGYSEYESAEMMSVCEEEV